MERTGAGERWPGAPRLVNGSTGDPILFLDGPGRDDALLFDAGDNARLPLEKLADLEAVFLTHHHIDHFVGFDRVLRANLDRDKTLRVIGPAGTIRRVHDRINSYRHPFFPFQKIVFRVDEILPGRTRTALLECVEKFRRPAATVVERTGPVVFETAGRCVEAAEADHTVPCLAFALVENPGVAPRADALAEGPIPPGSWVGHALKLLRSGADASTPVRAGEQTVPLGELADRYFAETPGARTAYVTDTAWSARSKPGLLALAQGARRLYCDAFYSDEDRDRADKHRHMTARQAGEFAAEAEVHELILIHFAGRYQGRYETLVDEARAAFPRVSAEIEGHSA